MINARIRKAYLSNNTRVISLNDLGDLTYNYQSLNGRVKTIKDIFENNNELSKEIIESKKPMIVFGESFFKTKSASYLFNLSKKFLFKNNKLNDDWNPINILSVDAATVGNLDLDIIDKNNKILDELHENKFEIIFLLGQDNLDFKKKDEFIIYQGSHGDRGAEIADLIFPAATYTEQKGLYENLEGRIKEMSLIHI